MSTNPANNPEWPQGYGCIALETVDSTMAEAARLAGNIAQPTWVMARYQTAARGRRGRPWVNPRGNLAATLIYHPFCTPEVAAQRSFVAANALLETLALYVDRTKLALKWPNDVLLNGGKVAGILLETSGNGPFVNWLSVGIGVNLREVPQGVQDAAFQPVSLKTESGHLVSRAEFMTHLAGAFATQERKLEKFGFDRIRADWLKHAAKLGEQINAVTPTEVITGLFDTIDKDGNLVLITAKGPRTIRAADVHF